MSKTFFCSSIKSVIQIGLKLQGSSSKRSNNHLYASLHRLKIHAFNYMVITFRYFNGAVTKTINYNDQNKLANPFIYKLIPNRLILQYLKVYNDTVLQC